MTQIANPATTAPKPRLDHNAEWDATDGDQPRHKPSDVNDSGALDSLGRAISEPLRPTADTPVSRKPR